MKDIKGWGSKKNGNQLLLLLSVWQFLYDWKVVKDLKGLKLLPEKGVVIPIMYHL